ncbi:MAG: hypothetical protein KDI13_04025 [Alphaproteobacteria bacterium]|nr:hypothetical protein [Alphaproteobacteria bacterium]
MMSEEDTEDKKELKTSMGKDWGSSLKTELKPLFASPSDFDIFCDREIGQVYIFHGPELNCTIDYMEYNPETQRVTIYATDGQKLDLGARIQWLVRPYFAKAQDIMIIRTKDGETIDGVEVPMIIKGQEKPKTLH